TYGAGLAASGFPRRCLLDGCDYTRLHSRWRDGTDTHTSRCAETSSRSNRGLLASRLLGSDERAALVCFLHDAPHPSFRGDFDSRLQRFLSGELGDYAGTQVNRITSSPIRSLVIRRSGGRGPAKYGLPGPNNTGGGEGSDPSICATSGSASRSV